MTVHEFAANSLESVDRLEVQLAVFPFFADERPLRGAAGLADWRLGGALSRKLMAGYLEGAFGEKGLITSPGKLRVDGVLLYGLGQSDVFDDARADEACEGIAAAIAEVHASTVALTLPGRSLGRVPALRAMERWLAVEPRDGPIEELTVIEASEEHRALAALVDGLRRQSESPLQ